LPWVKKRGPRAFFAALWKRSHSAAEQEGELIPYIQSISQVAIEAPGAPAQAGALAERGWSRRSDPVRDAGAQRR
jgi:hypothetical protein